jgi:ABC-type amino acid transport substrate-binding protein
VEDPATGAVTGLGPDIVNEIASQLGIKVVWRKFNWSTMLADMKRGEIDMLADPILQTVPRGREFAFSEPYVFLPSGVGIIRQGGKRLASFSDLNDPTIKVAVGLGLGEETLLRARAPKADILAVPVSTDTNAAANVVLAGRADVAIVNLNDAKRFLDANPGKLEALWMDNPPAYMPAGFALRFGDELGASFLNVALRNLKYTGTLSSLARRHGAEADLRGPGGGP